MSINKNKKTIFRESRLLHEMSEGAPWEQPESNPGKPDENCKSALADLSQGLSDGLVDIQESEYRDAAQKYIDNLTSSGESRKGHEKDMENFSIKRLEYMRGLKINDENKKEIVVLKIVDDKTAYQKKKIVEVKRRAPKTQKELDNLISEAENELLQIRSGFYEKTGDEDYKKYFEEKINKSSGSSDLDEEYKRIELSAVENPEKAHADLLAFREKLQPENDALRQKVEAKIFNNLLNNRLISGYGSDARMFYSQTQGFTNSLQTLFEQIQRGETPTDYFLQKVREEGQKTLDNGLRENLIHQHGEAKRMIRNLKFLDGDSEFVTKINKIEDALKKQLEAYETYLKQVTILSRKIQAVKGTSYDLESFGLEVGKELAVLTAAVAAAVAMGLAITATGGLAGAGLLVTLGNLGIGAVATGTATAVASSWAQAAIDGNTNQISDSWEMTKAIGGSIAANAAAGVAGQAVGTVGGKILGHFAKDGTALQKAAAERLQALADKYILKLAKAPKGEKTLLETLKEFVGNVGEETGEEILENTLQKIGEGEAGKRPVLGFVMQLIPSITKSGKKAFLSSAKCDVNITPSTKASLDGNNLRITYENPAEMVDLLRQRNIPPEKIEIFEQTGRLEMTEDGIKLSIETHPDTTRVEEDVSMVDPKTVEETSKKLQKVREKFKTDKALFEAIFGFSPMGPYKIEMTQLSFRVAMYNPIDTLRMQTKDNIAQKIQKVFSLTSFGRMKTAEIDIGEGETVSVNVESYRPYGITGADSTVKHEFRHVVNNENGVGILTMRGEKISLEDTDTEAVKMEKVTDFAHRISMKRVKDEISAFIIGGTNRTVLKYVKFDMPAYMGGSYDFKISEDFWHEAQSQGKFTDQQIAEMKKMAAAKLDVKKEVDKAYDAVEALESKGMSRNEAVNYLTSKENYDRDWLEVANSYQVKSDTVTLKNAGVYFDDRTNTYVFEQATPQELVRQMEQLTTSANIENDGSVTVVLKSGETLNIKRQLAEGYSPETETVAEITSRRLSPGQIISYRTFSDVGARTQMEEFHTAQTIEEGVRLFREVSSELERGVMERGHEPAIDEIEGEVENVICATSHAVNLKELALALSKDQSIKIPQLSKVGVDRTTFIKYIEADLEITRQLNELHGLEASFGNIISRQGVELKKHDREFLAGHFQEIYSKITGRFDEIDMAKLEEHAPEILRFKDEAEQAKESALRYTRDGKSEEALIEIEKVFVLLSGIDAHLKSYLAGTPAGKPWAHYLDLEP